MRADTHTGPAPQPPCLRTILVGENHKSYAKHADTLRSLSRAHSPIVMPTIDSISEDIFQQTMNRAVQDVFRTMLSSSANLVHGSGAASSDGVPWKHPVDLSGAQIVGTVGFIGDISGLIYLYFSANFSKFVAGQMLGMSLQEIDESSTVSTL